MRAPAGPASSLRAHSRVHLHNRRFIQVRRPDRAAHSTHDLLALRSELAFRLLGALLRLEEHDGPCPAVRIVDERDEAGEAVDLVQPGDDSFPDDPKLLLALCGVDPLDLDQPSEHASSFRRNVAAILCLVGRSLNLGLLWRSPAIMCALDQRIPAPVPWPPRRYCV